MRKKQMDVNKVIDKIESRAQHPAKIIIFGVLTVFAAALVFLYVMAVIHHGKT